MVQTSHFTVLPRLHNNSLSQKSISAHLLFRIIYQLLQSTVKHFNDQFSFMTWCHYFTYARLFKLFRFVLFNNFNVSRQQYTAIIAQESSLSTHITTTYKGTPHNFTHSILQYKLLLKQSCIYMLLEKIHFSLRYRGILKMITKLSTQQNCEASNISMKGSIYKVLPNLTIHKAALSYRCLT